MSSVAPRRVLMLLSNDFSPDPRVHKEAQTLAGSGYDVTIAAMRRRASDLPDEETRDGVTVRRFDVGDVKTGKVLDVSYRLRVFARKVLAWQAHSGQKWDVVHSHDLDTLSLGKTLKNRMRARLVYDAHEYFPGYTARRWLNLALRVNESLLIGAVDAFVHAGPARAALFWGAHPGVIDKPFIYLQNLPRRAVSFTKAPGQRIRVQYQGVLNPDRCIGEICEALALLDAETRKGFELQFYGQETEYARSVQARLPELGLADLVSFHGFLPASDLALATQRVDVGLVALRGQSVNARYPEPNKLYDYMAAKCLVIAQDVPGLRDVVLDHALGALCDFGNPRSIADALLMLREMPNLGEEQERVFSLHAERFNWESQEDRLLELYARLLAGGA